MVDLDEAPVNIVVHDAFLHRHLDKSSLVALLDDGGRGLLLVRLLDIMVRLHLLIRIRYDIS